jgi:hypothetical protein
MDEVVKMWNRTQDVDLTLNVLRNYMNRDVCRAQNSPRSTITGRVQGEISKGLLMMEHMSSGSVTSDQRIKGTIVGISATYFAAKAVGLASSQKEIRKHRVQHVMAKFKERSHELMEEARKRPASFFKSSSALRQLVNLEFQWLLMHNFFDPEATIFFKRDWRLGHTPFRTVCICSHKQYHKKNYTQKKNKL